MRAAFIETPVDLVIPTAMTSAAGGIYVAEFSSVRRADAPTLESLTLASRALYELAPPVKGI